jgi:hypothetical protein
MPTREDPATSVQIRTIARLAQAVGDKSPIEGRGYTIGQAGRLIRELEMKVKAQRLQVRRLKGRA